MRKTAHSSQGTQVFSMFGGYVPEQHTDETLGNIAPSDIDDAVRSLTVSMFSEVLQSLRAALSINSGRMV
jgi:hypothetical protein